MKNKTTKILLILLATIVCACSVSKRVPKEKLLLVKNEIWLDGKKTNDEVLLNQLFQTPNSSIAGYRFRLNLYNLAKPNPDSSFAAWLKVKPKRAVFLQKWLSDKQVQRLGKSFFVVGLSKFLKKSGEAPVILDSLKTQRSAQRLTNYYFNKGFFGAKINYKTDTLAPKKAKITYNISTGKAFTIDAITTQILSPAIDSLYKKSEKEALLKTNMAFDRNLFVEERKRLTNYFRNNGIFHFQETNINFLIDTSFAKKKVDVVIKIDNQSIKKGESTVQRAYVPYKIGNVSVFIDNKNNQNASKAADSLFYNQLKIYSAAQLRLKPKTLSDVIFITPGTLFSETKKQETLQAINNLKLFNYPLITYVEDTLQHTLQANIYLKPYKKFDFNITGDFTHSNIQDFGISGNMSLSINNIFRGAERLSISTRGNLGSSKDLANPRDVFFNLSEYGADIKLFFPRVLAPFSTAKLLPKNMYPNTNITFGISAQQNIGLDKQSLLANFYYDWIPKKNATARFDLLNLQYVRNVNKENYFNVYQSSYNSLNEIAQTVTPNTQWTDSNGNLTISSGGANAFTNAVLSNQTSITTANRNYNLVRSIEERRKRLTENNLIYAASYAFSKTTKENIQDKNFYAFKTKIETAGNVLSLLSALQKEGVTTTGKTTFFNVEYAQYIKGEVEFIKHWNIGRQQVLALRQFYGLAIPYGNSSNIPFVKSYFAGGSNDNRAWQSYGLGPGRSGSQNDFNEANMKIAVSAEYRFPVTDKWQGALFVDAGNIWNVFDDALNENAIFKNINSLKDLAIGTGFGIRYDFRFFIGRLDYGLKTYNPANYNGNRMFKDFNLSKGVLNIGINYPF